MQNIQIIAMLPKKFTSKMYEYNFKTWQKLQNNYVNFIYQLYIKLWLNKVGLG